MNEKCFSGTVTQKLVTVVLRTFLWFGSSFFVNVVKIPQVDEISDFFYLRDQYTLAYYKTGT